MRNPLFVKMLVPVLLCMMLCSTACISHMSEAKFYFAQGERLARTYKTEEALASFKKARAEAEREARKRPSAQAYMVKGMAELSLEDWSAAEESFREAFAYGFEKGEEWAEQLALFGLAGTFRELGLEGPALRVYEQLLAQSRFRPVTRLAAQAYTDIVLTQVLTLDAKTRRLRLLSLLRRVEDLSRRDLSCGFYHYLLSQVHSHTADYRRSFEEAVMARELGLPSEEVFRDNDNQIVFCYQHLESALTAEEWTEFQAKYLAWVERWNWPAPDTPPWKKR